MAFRSATMMELSRIEARLFVSTSVLNETDPAQISGCVPVTEHPGAVFDEVSGRH